MTLIGLGDNTAATPKPKGAEWAGDWELTDYEPLSQTEEWTLIADGKMIVRTVQRDVSGLLKNNAARRAESHGTGWGGGRVVASIPASIFETSGLGEALIGKDKKFIAKFLNDSDNEYFRTHEGRI